MDSSPSTPGDQSLQADLDPRPDGGALGLDLLNITEIAAALRVSKMTVYRFVRDGRLPAIRVGRSFRVHRRDMEAYLHAAYQPPPDGESPSGPDGPALPPA